MKNGIITSLSLTGNLILMTKLAEANRQNRKLSDENDQLQRELRSIRAQFTEQQRVTADLRSKVVKLENEMKSREGA